MQCGEGTDRSQGGDPTRERGGQQAQMVRVVDRGGDLLPNLAVYRNPESAGTALLGDLGQAP